MELLQVFLNQFGVFLLIFTRVSGIFAIAPFYGSRNIPVQVKAGMTLILSFILLPLVASQPMNLPTQVIGYLFLVIKEFLIGLMIGFASSLVFSAVQMAGHVIDLQVGFGVVNVLDPQFGEQVPLIGNFKYILALLVFLLTNGHHILLQALFASFMAVPLTQSALTPPLAAFFTDLFVSAFITAIKISLPIMVAVFLTDVALGIIARTVPQMNVFVVGIPAKIITGIIVLTLVIPVYLAFIEMAFNGMYSDLFRLLSILR